MIYVSSLIHSKFVTMKYGYSGNAVESRSVSDIGNRSGGTLYFSFTRVLIKKSLKAGFQVKMRFLRSCLQCKLLRSGTKCTFRVKQFIAYFL